MATLQELETHYSIADLERANLTLDLQAVADRRARDAAKLGA